MTEWVNQRICIKFCIKLEHFSMETMWIIWKAFGDDATNAVQIKLWHKCFKDGWESVESDPCSGRLATSRTPENAECVRAAISKDWRTGWGPKVPTWKGTEASLFYIKCALCLLQQMSLLFIFTWLNTFWTDMHICVLAYVICIYIYNIPMYI